MRRSTRRLIVLLAALPVTLVILAYLYKLGMASLEGQERSFLEALEWAAETLTTTGYGHDANWTNPAMTTLVVLTQFVGVFMVFLVFPIFIIPFFEERFEGRLPKSLPELDGHIVVYRYGPEVASLIDQLGAAGVPVVVFEEDVEVARRLYDRGQSVVYGKLEEDPDLSNLARARGLVANGTDNDNAVITLGARQQGFEGPIVALVERPSRRNPMLRVGATAAFTPEHVLAAAIASKASLKISPRVAGVQSLGRHLEIAEVRIDAKSSLAGKTLAECGVRARTGATIIGQWIGGELHPQPSADAVLPRGAILVAAGSHESMGKLADLATPVAREGACLILGHREVGAKVAEFLVGAGEDVRVVAPQAGPGVDYVGDVLDQELLLGAGVSDAQSVVIALENDSATLFAASVVRDLSAEATIIAGVRNADNVARIRRAGADFALSVGQVAGQLLTYQLLGEESVSLEAQLKLVKALPGRLAGKRLLGSRVRERTGCSIVAVERGDEILLDFGPEFELREGDTVYVSGTPDTLARYFEVFPDARPAAS